MLVHPAVYYGPEQISNPYIIIFHPILYSEVYFLKALQRALAEFESCVQMDVLCQLFNDRKVMVFFNGP